MGQFGRGGVEPSGEHNPPTKLNSGGIRTVVGHCMISSQRSRAIATAPQLAKGDVPLGILQFQNGCQYFVALHGIDLSNLELFTELSYRVISTAVERLKYTIQLGDDLDPTIREDLPKILLDLANYKHDDLIQHSLLLLDRYYTCQSDLFDRAFQSQLLKTPQSSELYNIVEQLLLELQAYLKCDSNSEVRKSPSPIKLLTKYCWLDEEVEGFELHQINQNIILSFGNLLLETRENLHVENPELRSAIWCSKVPTARRPNTKSVVPIFMLGESYLLGSTPH